MPAPFADSYVVPHTGLVAGEYPGSLNEASARHKLGALLAAGVTTFIDLTAEQELAPYEPLLQEIAAAMPDGHRVTHRRLTIRDMDVPIEGRMLELLDAIDEAMQRGERVYVHCWGGVGRTGTVVGCHLVRHGLTAEEALQEVARLFGTTSPAKRRRHPEGSPQTDAQRDVVRTWREPSRPAPDRAGRAERPPVLDRFAGALVGLAVGDALGTTLEFKHPGSFRPIDDMVGGGPFGLAPGQWTDDTSMAMCLAESLIERGRFDPTDQMERYVRWWREGHWSSTGRCFDIGRTTVGALSAFLRSANPYAGSTAERSAGNGSLMRLAPVPMFFEDDAERAIAMAGESSRTTHGTAMAVDACRYFAALLIGALRGESKETLLAARYTPVKGLWEQAPLHPRVDAVAAGSFRHKSPPEIRGTGLVIDTLEAALWAFATTDDFTAGALAAVNLGDDADTTGAVYGQIAGAYYGVQSIPEAWRSRLTRGEEIGSIAERLAWGEPRYPASRRTRERAAVRELMREHGGDFAAVRRVIEQAMDEMGFGGPMHAQAGADYSLRLLERWERAGGEPRESRPELDAR